MKILKNKTRTDLTNERGCRCAPDSSVIRPSSQFNMTSLIQNTCIVVFLFVFLTMCVWSVWHVSVVIVACECGQYAL